MQTRTVELTDCRDAAHNEGGVRIPHFVHTVEVTEPSECRCEKCAI